MRLFLKKKLRLRKDRNAKFVVSHMQTSTITKLKGARVRGLRDYPTKVLPSDFQWMPTAARCNAGCQLLQKHQVMHSKRKCQVPSLNLTASLPLKIATQKGNLIFQPSIFRCYVSFREFFFSPLSGSFIGKKTRLGGTDVCAPWSKAKLQSKQV